ncbi:hypothetical protein ACJJTC_007022 [Scirpophaga incertulas]
MAQPETKSMPNGVIGRDRGQNAEASQEDVLNVDEHLPEYKEFVASTDHSNKKKEKTVGEKKEPGQQIRDSKNLQKREGDVTSPATRYARLPPALRLAPLIRQRAQEIQLRPV